MLPVRLQEYASLIELFRQGKHKFCPLLVPRVDVTFLGAALIHPHAANQVKYWHSSLDFLLKEVTMQKTVLVVIVYEDSVISCGDARILELSPLFFTESADFVEQFPKSQVLVNWVPDFHRKLQSTEILVLLWMNLRDYRIFLTTITVIPQNCLLNNFFCIFIHQAFVDELLKLCLADPESLSNCLEWVRLGV